jgi:hypothetical protein
MNKLTFVFIVALSAFCGLAYLFVVLAVALYYPTATPNLTSTYGGFFMGKFRILLADATDRH